MTIRSTGPYTTPLVKTVRTGNWNAPKQNSGCKSNEIPHRGFFPGETDPSEQLVELFERQIG